MAARLAEKLLVLCDRGQGLLVRVYNMKKTFDDDNKTDTASTGATPTLSGLLTETKAMTALVKTVLAAKKFAQAAASLPGAKYADELLRLKRVRNMYVEIRH
jgi:hypothetical protein